MAKLICPLCGAKCWEEVRCDNYLACGYVVNSSAHGAISARLAEKPKGKVLARGRWNGNKDEWTSCVCLGNKSPGCKGRCKRIAIVAEGKE